MSPYAKIIADSISPDGVRLTTMEVRFHRFVLAEFNTHRVFSRSSASSRAIPLRKQVAKVRDGLAMPVVFPVEQKGMQGGDALEGQDLAQTQSNWAKAAEWAIDAAEVMGGNGVHKSVANRLLEPFMWHTVVVTSTAWENFFFQRCSPMAQPEIRVAAEMMRDALVASTPDPLAEGMWHLPYIEQDTWSEVVHEYADQSPEVYYRRLAEISAARCARVSYLTQDGTRDPAEDLSLYARLTERQKDTIHEHDPIHWAPLEHVGTPWEWNRQEGCIHFGQDPDADHDTFTCIPMDHLPRVGNLLGWRSLRTTVEAEQQKVTFR